MKKSLWRVATSTLSIAVALGIYTTTNAVEKTNKAYISIDRNAMGQNFVMEPTTYEYTGDVNIAQAISQLMNDKENLAYSGTLTGTSGAFYLQCVKNVDPGTLDKNSLPSDLLNMPQIQKMNFKTENSTGKNLCERSYTSSSGWMYTLNGKKPNVGMGGTSYLKDGDVVRIQFSWLAGQDFETTKKEDLLKELAAFTQFKNKDTWNKDSKEIYTNAVNIAQKHDSSQESIDNIISLLQSSDFKLSALNGILDSFDETTINADFIKKINAALNYYNSLSSDIQNSLDNNHKNKVSKLKQQLNSYISVDLNNLNMTINRFTDLEVTDENETLAKEIIDNYNDTDILVKGSISNDIEDKYNRILTSYNELQEIKENAKSMEKRIVNAGDPLTNDGTKQYTWFTTIKLYDAYSDKVKSYISENNKDLLEQARENLEKEQPKVTELENVINSFEGTDVTIENQEFAKKIIDTKKAASMYVQNAINEETANKFKEINANYTKLTNALKGAKNTHDAILQLDPKTNDAQELLSWKKAITTYNKWNDYVKSFISQEDHDKIAVAIATLASYKPQVDALINLIENFTDTEVTVDNLEQAKTLVDTYTNSGVYIQSEITGATKTKLNKLTSNYKAFIKEQVDNVITNINAIPEEVTLKDETVVNTANEAYLALTTDLKEAIDSDLVTKLNNALQTIKDLKAQEAINQEKANETITLINSLPTDITLESKEAVEQATTAYNALTKEQQALITEESLTKLTKAQDTIKALEQSVVDQKAVKSVTDKITALPTSITLNDKEAVQDAQKAYNALTKEQQALISQDTLKTLTDAQATITKLEKEQTASKNKAAANKAITAINAIASKVNIKDKAKIETARKTYNALTADQKKLVTNYSKLTSAESALAKLQKDKTYDKYGRIILEYKRDKNNKIIEKRTHTYYSNTTKVKEYRRTVYNTKGVKVSYDKYNYTTSGTYTQRYFEKFYSNGKIKTASKFYKYSKKVYQKHTLKAYNSKGIRTSYKSYTYDKKGSYTSKYYETYTSKNKIATSKKYYNYYKKQALSKYTKYYKNGVISNYKKYSYSKKGKYTKKVFYYYNKKGKLDTNKKYGKATRKTYYYNSKGKQTKVSTKTYK